MGEWLALPESEIILQESLKRGFMIRMVGREGRWRCNHSLADLEVNCSPNESYVNALDIAVYPLGPDPSQVPNNTFWQ